MTSQDIVDLANRDSERVDRKRREFLKQGYHFYFWWSPAERGDQYRVVANMYFYRESAIGRAAARMLPALMWPEESS